MDETVHAFTYIINQKVRRTQICILEYCTWPGLLKISAKSLMKFMLVSDGHLWCSLTKEGKKGYGHCRI